MKISDVMVGPRYRRELGDIASLAHSIAEVGLLHPIVVRPDRMLIAGRRRLAACQQPGWDEIPATEVDLDEILRGELAENVARKDFLPSEIDAIRRALEPLERAAAAERMTLGKISIGSKTGTVRDRIGALVGISGKQLDKIAHVVKAAEEEPEHYGHLVAEMDDGGSVDGIFRRLKVRRQAGLIRQEPPPLPCNGPYRVIVADPPWPYELRKDDPSHRAALPYPEMSIDAIRELDVAGLAHADCILWLWTTNAHHRDAYAVLDAWGFEHKTTLTWVKDKMGVGHWLRGQTEHCLMAVRGHPLVGSPTRPQPCLGKCGRIPRSRNRFTSLSSASVPRRAMLVYFPETAGRAGICTVMRPIVPWGHCGSHRLCNARQSLGITGECGFSTLPHSPTP